MDSVSPLNTAGASYRQPGTDASKANLDYSAFLRLFIASMKNQDPTQPNDPSQTMSQLASFSNVEQSIKLNEKLDALLASTNANVATGLIGKMISSLDGKLSGNVLEVSNTAGGLVAELEGGGHLNLAEGYRITAS